MPSAAHRSDRLEPMAKVVTRGKEPLLSQSVAREVNSFLTVHGELEIDTKGTLRFTPGLDARLMGQVPLEIPLSSIRGVRRTDGGRRVSIEGDTPLVLRGATAQLAWVILGTLLDSKTETDEVISKFFPAVAHLRLRTIKGILGVGRSGLGFGGGQDQLLSMAPVAVWARFNDIDRLQMDYPGIHIVSGGTEHAFACTDPLRLRNLIVERWFASANPALAKASWSCLAVRREGLSVRLGRLAILVEGLVFQSADQINLLIPRRRAGVLEVEEITHRDGPELCLIVGTGEDHLGEFHVQEPIETLHKLDELLADATWFPPDPESLSLALAGVQGPAAYVHLWLGHRLLARRDRVAVAPFGGKVRLKLDQQSDPPNLPAAVRLEVANVKGRFLMTGILREWIAPDPKRSRGAPLTERTLTITLEEEVIQDNRREHYRLPLKEPLPILQLQPPPLNGRVTLPTPIDIEDAVLLDISRTGASAWLPRRPAPQDMVVFQLVVELHPEEEDEPKRGGEEELPENIQETIEEPTIETFKLMGSIVYHEPYVLNKKEGWRVGISFLPECDGMQAFDARQREFLRLRAEDRDRRAGY